MQQSTRVIAHFKSLDTCGGRILVSGSNSKLLIIVVITLQCWCKSAHSEIRVKHLVHLKFSCSQINYNDSHKQIIRSPERWIQNAPGPNTKNLSYTNVAFMTGLLCQSVLLLLCSPPFLFLTSHILKMSSIVHHGNKSVRARISHWSEGQKTCSLFPNEPCKTSCCLMSTTVSSSSDTVSIAP